MLISDIVPACTTLIVEVMVGVPKLEIGTATSLLYSWHKSVTQAAGAVKRSFCVMVQF